jgi:hypothetical protein
MKLQHLAVDEQEKMMSQNVNNAWFERVRNIQEGGASCQGPATKNPAGSFRQGLCVSFVSAA